MAGGQQINSAQGTIIALGGDNNFALSGSASTSAVGDVAKNRFHPLRSRKVGGGSASAVLVGQAITGAQGAFTAIKAFALVGSAVAVQSGVLLYRGQVTISWNAVTTNSDGSPITDLAGYLILHGTTTGIYFEDVTLGLVTSYVWTGLMPSNTHFFVVQAYDTSNLFSGNSAEVSKGFAAFSPGGFVEAQGT